MRYATVALPIQFKYHSGGSDGLTYAIPDELSDSAQVGVRVLVPLGRLERTGVLVATTDKAPDLTQKIRPIIDVLDAAPIFDEQFLEWSKWIASYYLTSWGEVLAAALPEGLKPETKSRVYLAGGAESKIGEQTKHREQILSTIKGQSGGIAISMLQRKLKVKALHATLNRLELAGLIRIERQLGGRTKQKMVTVASLPEHLVPGTAEFSIVLTELERVAPRQANILLAVVQHGLLSPDEPLAIPLLLKGTGASASTLKSVVEKGFLELKRIPAVSPRSSAVPDITGEHDISSLKLTAEQKIAVQAISSQIELGEHRTFLLHGITGSGKTEVYITLARRVLESGGGVLILVPEISLTPQLIDRFRSRLSIADDAGIAVLHSRMSQHERFAAWKSLTEGETKLAIGARSAVFAPVKNLQLIIVDEEHEGAYKQYDQTPRYNARDAAVVRAALLKCVAILGSATPSLESYYNAEEGKYTLLRMTERAKNAVLPNVKIVDMRQNQVRKGVDSKHAAFSSDLVVAIQDRLDRKEGVVLFQNRRGFSTYLQCLTCGEAVFCPNCTVTLTYHQAAKQLRCHYCGYVSPMLTSCPVCGSAELRLGGLGTQRVEEDINELFPQARVDRMDLDTTARKGAFHRILSAFAEGKTDILLGTQMVAKGLDFPRVTLVGIISADTNLSLPDFRSSERTFQLISQALGRAGRSSEFPGEVIVQTLQPTASAIQLAAAHNYKAFYDEEIAMRRTLGYPPFTRLILIEFRGLHEASVKQRAFEFAQLFPERASYYDRLGPAPPSIPKLRGEYRWHILLKNHKIQDPNGERIRRLLSGALDQYQNRFASAQVRVTIDVDVQGVL